MSALVFTRTNTTSVCDACARVIGRKPMAPTPDAIASVAGVIEWKSFPDWEAYSDSEIAAETRLYDIALMGKLYVVTEAALTSREGPIVVNAVDLRKLIAEHLRLFGECFFNGDVVIMEAKGNNVWLFHHEGQYALISRTKLPYCGNR